MYNFKNTLGFETSKKHAEMSPDYNPELDTTELWTDTEKVKYWKYISDMKWYIDLGRIYIMYATVFLSWYRPSPHKVHLSNIKHLYE